MCSKKVLNHTHTVRDLLSHGLIKYKGTKTKCLHLIKFTCKGTLKQMFV
jgi:hypothetical protein